MIFLVIVAMIVGFVLMGKRLTTLESQVRALEGELTARPFAAPPQVDPLSTNGPDSPSAGQVVGANAAKRRLAQRASAPQRKVATIVSTGQSAPAFENATTFKHPISTSEDVKPAFSLERFIGGSLPIWIGGAALVLAGFFLVRYSIESGLLGPSARTLLAALFALGLIGGSEVARRLPATQDDPRVAQALAGAGVASFYATLYLAAALYHLISPLTAFFGVVVVTGAALALSLRHGPPTAVMALIGGVAAPMVAGFDAVEIGPLMVYLGLLVAALFGLAIYRGWGWLALAAIGAGFLWVNFLLAEHGGAGGLSALGVFTMLLAVGGSVALPATGVRQPWLRLGILMAGLVQLLLLAPALDFGPLAWSFYLLLAAAVLFLAWRDHTYLPAVPVAILVLLLLEGVALAAAETKATPIAALIATALFALPGFAFLRRGSDWVAAALLGVSGPLLVAHAMATQLLPALGWGALELVAAVATFYVAWQMRGERDSGSLIAATAFTGLLASIGFAQFAPDVWLAVPLSIVALGLAAWARYVRVPILYELPAYPLAAAVIAASAMLFELGFGILWSVAGDKLPYPNLPEALGMLRALALPVAVAFGLAFMPENFGRARRALLGLAAALATLLLYVLAKQFWAISTAEAFVRLGFIERAILTQMFLGGGWLLLRRTSYQRAGELLLAVGFARFLWFDVVIFNPAMVAQAVGGLPLLNAATLHAALVAFWLWTLPSTRWRRVGAGLATLLAALVTIRQVAHGSILTGPIQTAENLGYSAALLGVALFWLWRGISAGRYDLRIAGLGLLTLVTFKVFLIDAAALDGILRILSFLGLGVALIGIGWAYNRFLGKGAAAPQGAQYLGG